MKRYAALRLGAARSDAPMPLIFGSLAAWLLYPIVLRGVVPAAAVLMAQSVDDKGVRGVLRQPTSAPLVPVVYSKAYDITAGGMEKAHPFDSTKYSKVMHLLQEADFASPAKSFTPVQLPLGVLAQSQSIWWLISLGYGSRAALALELLPLVWLPSWLVWWLVLEPMQLAMAGSVGAVELALERPEGWSINLSGGYHHARRDLGHGFCVHNDLTLAARHALAHGCRRILYLDLDVHQGDGFEWDMGEDERICVLDAFRSDLFPGDEDAAGCAAIVERGQAYHHTPGGKGTRFLSWLERELPRFLREFDPDLVIYNAGTDILDGDPLGGMRIPASGVASRDAIVFRSCGIGYRHASSPAAKALLDAAGGKKRPVAMMLSGGYQDVTSGVIASSILALDRELGLVE